MASQFTISCDWCGKFAKSPNRFTADDIRGWVRLQPEHDVWYPGIGNAGDGLKQNSNDFCSFTCALRFLLDWRKKRGMATIAQESGKQ